MDRATHMKRANRFLDLEASVDNDEDEDEGNESDIIDDDFPEDVGVEQYNQSWRRFADADENPNVMGDLVADLEKRYAETSAPRTGEGSLPRPLENDLIIDSVLDGIVHLPRKNDTPLWRIRCRPGWEEDIVFYLFQKVVPFHELRTAFMRPSICGWVYLEANLNEHLHSLLLHMPGIHLRNSDIVMEYIEFKDWKSLLTMQSKETPKVGGWVGIRKGIYKGDVGYVNAVNAFGIQLLLVPRLPPPQPSGTLSKRKRHSPAIPTLFDPASIKEAYGIQPTHIAGDLYSFRGNRFDHGLIVKVFNFSSVLKVRHMPLRLVCHFLESGHPRVRESSTFPRPLEWEFAEGDGVEVEYWPLFEGGIITSLRSDSVEVELSNKEGAIVVSWLRIRKVTPLGNYVEVTGGEYRGRKGWYDGQEHGGGARVIELRDIEKSLDERITILETHVNLIKRIDAPFLLGKPSTHLQKTQSDRVPWIRTEVMIVGRHPLKARRGIVLDVLCKQETCSGLQICLEMTTLNPASPFARIVLDYDHVVEAKGGQKLYNYAPTKDELFIPQNFTLAVPQPFHPLPQSLSAYIDAIPPSATPGYATPMPENPGSSSSPAWNPSHVLPPDHEPSSRPPIQEPKHILLDSRLVDAQLRVVVTGGDIYKAKEMTASVQSVNQKLVIRSKFYHTWIPLDPEWVTPKYPNATHDNSLMIVICGDHCGKYVRRIYHRYEGEKLTVILGVVNRVAGQVDTLLEERLDLEISSLCLCMESKEDKNLNKSLMDAVRTEARKIRAK